MLEQVLLVFIATITTIIYLLHTLCKDKNDKFSIIINKLWEEWFEEQWSAILAFVFFVILGILVIIIVK